LKRDFVTKKKKKRKKEKKKKRKKRKGIRGKTVER
jgi:hypothetical protein